MAEDADNAYFKKLLALVPAHFHFIEDKNATQGIETGQAPGQTGRQLKNKRKHDVAFSSEPSSPGQDGDSARDEKIRGKKESKQKKKKKQREKTGPKINVQEAQEKLRARIAELQAKRANNLSSAEVQEQKRLERKQRKLNSKGKQKPSKKDGGAHKENGVSVAQQAPVRQLIKPVVTNDGKVVFSKFDFSQSGKKEKSSELAGKDYKRILARLEQRDAKVAKLKETDAEAGSRLEQKFIWKDVMTKARGEKIKDDIGKVKKAMKRKEKVKEQRQKKWKDRKATEEKMQKQRQQKRQDNIQKRKDEKKAKHRKKLIKKGRILPGF